MTLFDQFIVDITYKQFPGNGMERTQLFSRNPCMPFQNIRLKFELDTTKRIKHTVGGLECKQGFRDSLYCVP